MGPNAKSDAELVTETLAGDREAEGSYRIIYGDLRTEVVPDAKFAKLVPTASLD